MKKNLKIILFFGAPGSGKGTYSSLLQKDTNFLNLSMGDLLRQSSYNTFLRKGELLSDDIIISIFENYLKSKTNLKGLILDGFPRTIPQYDLLESKFPITTVVNCILREDILIEKLLGRRICKKCNKAYNLCTINKEGYLMEAMLPKYSDKCDNCSIPLSTREDDTEQIIKKRLIEYQFKTEPLLSFFQKKNLVIDFIPKKGVKDFPDFYNSKIKPLLFEN